MKFCFIDRGLALVMPVTPGSYRWSVGKRMETVNISELGDICRPGGQTKFAGSFDFLLPAQPYPWMEPGTRAQPQFYLDRLHSWARSREPVRFLITDTDINAMVYVEEVTEGERDGSGDRYVTVAVREQTALSAVEISGGDLGAASGHADGPADGGQGGAGQRYTVQPGDSLSMLCRRFYGNGTAKYYTALARHNGVTNPHLIFPGQVLTIPPVSLLLGG